ncbi:protein SLOW GREEN 1, chloroplastic-like [Ananas comosus]|uniref:Protein SLOW GREEN 1, chloroplastic-like n=1 Tax=Ananas comosus TaxID=4615 RepID=A0A6P5EB79_ANACO|nr:protein SLOW GREEN 1, chloroplastic-like [Ananas comosus]
MASLTAAAPINGERRLLSPFRSAALKAPSHPPPALRIAAAPPRKMRLHRVSRVRASSISDAPSPLLRTLRSAASGAVVLAALLSAKLSPSPARAEPSAPPPPPPATEERLEASGEVEAPKTDSEPSPLSQLLDSNPDAVRSVLYKTLEDGDDAEALSLLRRLIGARPSEPEWKLLAARLLCEVGDAAEARRLLEEVLAADPLSFEALFENAVLMDRCGEGVAALERLERALDLARAEHKERAARDVRLIIAQMQFLQKKVDEALTSYEELAREDPKDYRPYFCQGVIYSLLDRNTEARDKFSKYHELSPRNFDVDAYLQMPLSRIKLFGTDDSNA